MVQSEIPTSRTGHHPSHPVERVARLGPFVFLCTFVVVSGLYIVSTHAFLRAYATDPATVEEIGAFQDLAYVVVIGLLFFGLLALLLRSLTRATLEGERRLEALIQAERRSAAALVGSTIGHDLNNLLQVIELATPQGPQDLDTYDAESIALVREALVRARSLVARLRDFSKVEEQDAAVELDLGAEVQATITVVADHPALRGCDILVDRPDEPLQIQVQKQAVQQALLNLLVNAGDALKDGGKIRVRLRRDADSAVLEVHDSGPGIPVDLRDKIFSPLFTTKDEGTGLGLVVVQACAKAHGGHAEVGESDLGGACFRMVLPTGAPVAVA